LHGRNAELNRLNGDLMNLISSVRIAIVIVSSDLRIRRFTPMAEQVLNLIPGDVGRPIGQIKPNFHGVELDVLIREAMSEAAVLQREVRDAEGRRYSLTARPYKDVEDRIDGAVLSVFDVDASRRREKQLPHEGAYAQAIIETVREPLLVLDGELRVQVANQAFCDRFAISAERAVGQLIYELGGGQWNIAELRRLLAEIAPENGRFADFRVDFDLPEIGRRVLSINARRIEEGGGRPPLILLAIEDATPPRC
jgi:two-component system CheB/CheR fusion protein